MKESIRRRLERVADRHAEIERLLADPGVQARSGQFRELSMEFARIDPIALTATLPLCETMATPRS